MSELPAIENITVDGVEYTVDDLPENIQGAIEKYNDWRERLVVSQDEVNLVGAALRDLGGNIVNSIRQKEKADAEKSETVNLTPGENVETEPVETTEEVVEEGDVQTDVVTETVEDSDD